MTIAIRWYSFELRAGIEAPRASFARPCSSSWLKARAAWPTRISIEKDDPWSFTRNRERTISRWTVYGIHQNCLCWPTLRTPRLLRRTSPTGLHYYRFHIDPLASNDPGVLNASNMTSAQARASCSSEPTKSYSPYDTSRWTWTAQAWQGFRVNARELPDHPRR